MTREEGTDRDNDGNASHGRAASDEAESGQMEGERQVVDSARPIAAAAVRGLCVCEPAGRSATLAEGSDGRYGCLASEER